MHNSRIINNPLNWSTGLFQLSSQSPCLQPCSRWARRRVSQEAVTVPLRAPPGHINLSALVFCIFGTVNQRKERKYLEPRGHDSMSGRHTQQHHGDCPSTGDDRGSVPEAPAPTSRCPSLLLPLPSFTTTEEREQEEIFSLGFHQKEDTCKRDLCTQSQATGCPESMRKKAEFKDQEENCSIEHPTWSSTSCTHLAGKDLTRKSTLPGTAPLP